jgi:hypothetical protein
MQLDGPVNAKIVNPQSAITDVTDLTEKGAYTFELTVKDDKGAINRDKVKVEVLPEPPPAPKAPIAEAGDAQQIEFKRNGTVAQLDGTKSFDPDGAIVSYSWNLLNPATTVKIDFPNAPQTTVQFFTTGDYKFQLLVKDKDGLTATDEVLITLVKPEPVPPVADAGEKITLPFNNNAVTLQLDGSKSFDPDGQIVSYRWTMSPVSTAVSMQAGSSAKPTVQFFAAGVYTFLLEVKDNDGLTANASVEVNIQKENEQPKEKDCGSLEDLSARFAKYNFRVNEGGLYSAFAENYGQYGQVQRFFDYLNSKKGEPIEDLIKNLATGDFEGQDIPKLFQGWFEFIQRILIENNDLRRPAFELYRILLEVCFYLICVQQGDITKQELDFRDLLKMLFGQWQTWREMAERQAWSEADLKMIKPFEQLLSATKMQIEVNDDASKKKHYYKWLNEVLSIFNA